MVCCEILELLSEVVFLLLVLLSTTTCDVIFVTASIQSVHMMDPGSFFLALSLCCLGPGLGYPTTYSLNGNQCI